MITQSNCVDEGAAGWLVHTPAASWEGSTGPTPSNPKELLRRSQAVEPFFSKPDGSAEACWEGSWLCHWLSVSRADSCSYLSALDSVVVWLVTPGYFCCQQKSFGCGTKSSGASAAQPEQVAANREGEKESRFHLSTRPACSPGVQSAGAPQQEHVQPFPSPAGWESSQGVQKACSATPKA